MNNFLFVYPVIKYKKKGSNIYNYDGSIPLEDFFNSDKKAFIENIQIIKNSRKIDNFIFNHLGTWQRWLMYDLDQINKFRELKFLVNKISNWLEINKIEKIIFFTGAPHHIDTALIEIAARLKSIKTIFFYKEEVFTKLFLPMQREEFKFEYIFLKKSVKSKVTKEIIYNFQQNMIHKKIPLWIPKKSFFKKNLIFAFLFIIFWHSKKLTSKKNTITNLLQEINFQNDFYSLIKQKIFLSKISIENRKNKNEYNQINEITNIVIYGHYQPESTTLSEGGDFRDQIEIPNYLNLSGYQGNIFYKEHDSSFLYIDKIIGPTRVGLWKNKNFIENLRKHNVKIILDDSFINEKIIITCSGSIAVERSLNGLRTIVCGYPWYGDLPGTIRIENINWTKKSELDALMKFSPEIKNNAEIYLEHLLSYGLKLNSKESKITNNILSTKEFLDLFL